MKGNGEFVYFLVAGLMILAILIAIFGFSLQTITPSKPPSERGFIEVVKTFEIPYLQASSLLERTSTDSTDKYVFSGLLFGEDKIRYDLSKSALQDVKVRFTVKETNYYGKLNVKVNDMLLESRAFDPGSYELTVPLEQVSDHMVIEIYAESSAWRIWAPAAYVLEDVEMSYTSYFSQSSQYKFYLGEEYLNMQFAKVDIVLSENVGTLLVAINGRNIWTSPVADEQSIRMEKNDLRLGDNIITLRASQDSKLQGRGVIVVIYLSQYPEQINQSGIVAAVQPLTGLSSQFYG